MANLFFQIKSYFKFLVKSTNQHGVHSPFVFDLVTKCFYDKKKYPEYKTLDQYRKSLLSNNDAIDVKDFGAGSKVFKSNRRQISQIAKTAGISAKRAQLLFRTAKYFQPENALEIGTSLGLASCALSLGNTNSKITTLEGCSETANMANEQFSKFKLKNIDGIIAEFDAFFDNIPTTDNRQPFYNLIYFDGNHTKAATLSYFDKLLPTITNETCWIFDDIHWSAEMEEAWETIKQNPRVTVTIDTFQWGFVFFRKEQKKEDFVIRV